MSDQPGHMPQPRAARTTVVNDGQAIELAWDTGEVDRFWSYWLRLNVTPAGLFEGVSKAWTDGANFAPQTVSRDDLKRLRSVDVGDGRSVRLEWVDGRQARVDSMRLWGVRTPDPCLKVQKRPWRRGVSWCGWSYQEILQQESAMPRVALVEAYLRDGVVMIHDAPRDPLALRRLASSLGEVEPSHLGLEFHVKKTPDPRHIGEVTAGIPLHIDLVYRQYPPAVQALHALNQIAGGGENVFVDVYGILPKMRSEDEDILAETKVDFVADSASVHFRGTHHIIERDQHNEFVGVAYNQYKMVVPFNAPPVFFDAYDRFRELISSPENAEVFLIPQDSIVIFDNRRVLHGRKTFSDDSRHIIGCYISDDDLRSKYRVQLKRLTLAGEGA